MKFIISLSLVIFVCSFISCNKNDNVSPPEEETFTWQSTSLSNGAVKALAVNNNGIVFASIENDGIYKTSDNGDNWSKVKNGSFQSNIGNGYAECFCMDGNTLWVGTDGAGIHRSTDEGLTWTELNDGEPVGQVYTIQMRYEGSGGGTLYCGSDSGLFKLDEQNRWTRLLSDKITAIIMVGEGSSVQGIYAGGPYPGLSYETPSIIFWSANNGLTWYRTALPGIVKAFAKNSNGEVFAVTWPGGIFKTYGNRWYSWEPLNSDLEYYICETIAIPSSNHIYVGTSSGGVLRSTNDGESWTTIADGLNNRNVYELAINPSGYIFAGTEAGVFRGNL